MKLCDKLEQQQKERGKIFPVLSFANHTRLASRPSPVHLAAIFTAPPSLSPDDMRKTILTLGIEGKLTRDFASAKAPVSETTTLEAPFLIPEGWECRKLGELVEFIGGSQPPKSHFVFSALEGYTRLVQIRDFKSDKNLTFIPNELANRPFEEDDVMIGRYGPPVFQILRGLSGTYNVALMKAQPKTNEVSKDFLFYLLQEARIQDLVVAESDRTAGQSGVRKPLLVSFEIGLPHIEEQKIIVQRVEALFKIVDLLEKKLAQTKSVAELFARTAVDAVVGPKGEENRAVKPPKTKTVSTLHSDGKPKDGDEAFLAAILARHNGEMTAKDLWHQSRLSIEEFYLQLKKENLNGWIVEPTKAIVTEVKGD
jgi:hypothetical protein